MSQFQANENAPAEVVEAARQAGHDVAWIAELSPGVDDWPSNPLLPFVLP